NLRDRSVGKIGRRRGGRQASLACSLEHQLAHGDRVQMQVTEKAAVLPNSRRRKFGAFSYKLYQQIGSRDTGRSLCLVLSLLTYSIVKLDLANRRANRRQLARVEKKRGMPVEIERSGKSSVKKSLVIERLVQNKNRTGR